MQRLQAFKYELMPDGEQRRTMRRFSGSCRFVFNKALALQKERFEQGEKKMGYGGLCKQLTEWKAEPDTTWLRDTPSQALQQSLKDLERAYANFFARRAEFPRFKKKGYSDSFRYPQGTKLDQSNSRIFLPKLGWIRYRNSRDVMGTVKNVTIRKTGDKWFVSIQTEREVADTVHSSTSIVGVDLGIARFATLSDGTFIEPVSALKTNQQKLARAQRALARKAKFSSNWRKQKARINQLHTRIANIRRDALHKITTIISQSHAMVCIEDLKVGNMSRSAKGTVENPGTQVKAKSGLNRSILDQGWHEFRRQLEYKQAWRGGQVIAVNPRNTSRTCPVCDHVSAENRRTQAQFQCLGCGFEENADVVGAINVLRAGHARLACEVNGAIKPSAAGTHRSDPGRAPCPAWAP